MSFEDRIENLYLKVWRAVILCVATVALIAAVVASAIAVNGLMVDPPLPPSQLKPDERDGALQGLTLEKFRLADRGGPAPWPTETPAPRSDGGDANGEALRRIARNFDEYVKAAYPSVTPVPEATEWTVSQFMKGLALKSDAERRLYLATLEPLSGELARAGAEQARLPVGRRIDPHRVLRWHADNVQQTLQSLAQENEKLKNVYEQRLTDYANRHTRIMSYFGMAAGALAIFVLSILLFVIIRIERDLRMMAVASLATTRRLEG